jgi:hypothetical protein
MPKDCRADVHQVARARPEALGAVFVIGTLQRGEQHGVAYLAMVAGGSVKSSTAVLKAPAAAARTLSVAGNHRPVLPRSALSANR